MFGFTPRQIAVPRTPTIADRRKPAFDRSTRYHNTGFTSASVRDTCRVDSQGSFRFEISAQYGTVRILSINSQ